MLVPLAYSVLMSACREVGATPPFLDRDEGGAMALAAAYLSAASMTSAEAVIDLFPDDETINKAVWCSAVEIPGRDLMVREYTNPIRSTITSQKAFTQEFREKRRSPGDKALPANLVHQPHYSWISAKLKKVKRFAAGQDEMLRGSSCQGETDRGFRGLTLTPWASS